MTELRRLRPEDLQSFFDIRLRALQNAPTAFLSTYEQEKYEGPAKFVRNLDPAEKDRAIFGGVIDGKVVATVGIIKEDRTRTNHKATVWGVYVDEDFRGRGNAAKLLDLAIAFARDEMRVLTVGLSVETENQSARALYESRGFKKWGTEPMAMSHQGRYYDEDHMVLVL